MLRYLRPLLIACAILTLLAGLMGSRGPDRAAAGAAKVDPEVLTQLNRDGRGTFLVYLAEQADLTPAYTIRDWDERGWFVLNRLREVAGRTQPAVLRSLDTLRAAGHVARVQPYYIVNLIVVEGDAAALRALAGRPDVAAVYPETKLELVEPVSVGSYDSGPNAVEWNIAKIGADLVWSTYGVTGTGVVVANIDTGVEYNHPALVEQYRGNLGGGNFEHNYNWWDPQDLYDYPYPVEGSHGTHVMGTMIGDDGVGNQVGVAPGARWIAAAGCCPSLEALLSATEWIIAPWQVNDLDPDHPTADPAKRPHVVNNSWGGSGGRLTYNALLEQQRAAGILPVMSAGNNGGQCGTMGSPGDNLTAYSVGATDVNDNIAGFSSRGPDPFTSWMGLYGVDPDVSAPGVNIRSSVPGGGYESGWSGTSMASPHVSGLVALILSAEPDLIGRVDEIEELILRTAVPRTSTQQCGGVPGSSIPNNTFGWGRVDALAAVEMIWHAGTLAGTVTDAGSGLPVQDAVIMASRGGYTLTIHSDAAGAYEYLLGAGTYVVTVQAYGYQTWTASGVNIAQDGITPLNVALTALPVYTLAGIVDEGSLLAVGDPVGARVGARDTSVDLPTDPATGGYETPIAAGSYWLRVIARGYLPENRTITVTGDLAEDFSLVPTEAYYLRDSRSPCGPAFSWIDATDGEGHNVGDDAYFSLALTNSFSFYGNDYTTLFVGSNGYLSFGQGYSGAHMMIPFEGRPNNAIYGLEEDLNPANGAQGVVYHKYLDDGRYLVVEFHQVEHWASGYPETFEFILDFQTGAVLLQYLEVSLPDFATVGIENADGSDGILYSFANSADITNSLAVGFYPVYGGFPADQGDPAAYGTLSGTVYVSGTNTPVPGAAVTATSYLNVLTTVADPNGQYLFPDICADIYELQAAAPGYYPGLVAEARLRWPGEVAIVDLPLQPQQPEPSLVKTVSPVACGEPFTYTIHYANAGDGDLFGAVISDVLPIEVFYITSTPPGVYQDGVVTWTVDIPAGGSGEVAIVGTIVVPPAEAIFAVTNTAYLLWSGPTVAAQAAFDYAYVDLHLTKTVVPAEVEPGAWVTYTLSYDNMGCDLAFGVVLTDVVPAEVVYVTSTPPGVYQDGVLSWTLDLGNGEVGQATVVGWLTTTAVPGTEVINTAVLWHEAEGVTASASFMVLPAGCEVVQIAAITPTVDGCAVTLAAGLTGTEPFTYLWSFGDGVTSTAALPTHLFAQNGTYSGTLDVWNCAGAGHAAMPFTVEVACAYAIYLPVVMRSYVP